VLERLAGIPIDDRILELIASIAWYTDRVTDLLPEQMETAIINIIKGKEGIDMAEIIKNRYILEGFVKGEAQGELKGEIKAILIFLRAKFQSVPDDVIIDLSRRTDSTALESLAILAAQCKSLDEFARALK